MGQRNPGKRIMGISVRAEYDDFQGLQAYRNDLADKPNDMLFVVQVVWVAHDVPVLVPGEASHAMCMGTDRTMR